MKPKLGDDVTSSQSCSCTSCTYKSESDRPSLRKIVAQGSRIDKLYLGKFIPLRERQLIGKLVRTRAVYDDLRNQLFSESNLNITEKADLHPRTARRGKDLDDISKSNVILELINLIDKGEALGSRRLSECCSCCSCGSTIPLQEHEGRVHRHGRAHISSRSSVISGHRAKDERRKGKHALRKAKHISSDPCACTSKLSGFIRRESKAFIKKLHDKKPAQVMEPQPEFVEYQNYQIRSRGELEGYKVRQTGMGEMMRNSLTKIKQSKLRVANKIKTGTTKSLQALKNTGQKVKGTVEGSAQRTIHELRSVKQHEEITNNDENVFNTIKDSLTKYREDIEKKELLKEWECDLECNPEKCEPEECFRIITKKRLKRLHKGKNNAGDTELNPTEIPDYSSGLHIGLQAENQEKTTATGTKNQNIKKKDKNDIKVSVNDITTNIDTDKAKRDEANRKNSKKKNVKVHDKCFCEYIGFQTPPTTKSVKSNTSLQDRNSRASVQSIKKNSLLAEPSHEASNVPTKNKTLSKASPKTIISEREAKIEKSSVVSESTKRQAVRITSSFSFSIEFHKPKLIRVSNHNQENTHKRHKMPGSRKLSQHKSSNTSQSTKKNGLALRRCFCTLKLKPNKNKSNIYKNHKTRLVTSKSLQTMKLPQSPVLPYYIIECEPEASVPVKYDPIKCEKRIRKLLINHSSKTKNAKYKARSTPSLTSKSVYNGKSNRIRAYETAKTANASRKSKYSLAKYKLRRCFCTLKLAKPEKKINRKLYQSRGTFTSRQKNPMIFKSDLNKAAEEKGNVKYVLLPYECEPGICISTKCDPYTCLERINLKKNKTHTRQSGTNQHKTKSTYSIARTTHMKSVNVQPVSRRQKNGNVAPNRKLMPREMKSTPETRNKQAVRIGSSFSFDIEFFKEKSPSIHAGYKAATKEMESQEAAVKNRPMFSAVQTRNKDRKGLERQGMKRCFCTLKLHKMARNNQNKKTLMSTGTETDITKEKMYPSFEMATKGTKMKKVDHNNIMRQHLKSYECEPNFCVPGQCDPIQCLKRIKVREKVTSKEFGAVTSTLRRKSTSSATKPNKSKDAVSQSLQIAKRIKRYSYTPSTNSSGISSVVHKPRQAVKIGSNFSFNVEFCKNRSSNIISESGRPMPLQHKGDYLSKSRKIGALQTLDMKKKTKSSGIRPILKRCFCTLQLQNNKNIKNSITVMPVLVQNRTFSTLYKKLNKPEDSDNKRAYSSNFSPILSSTCTQSSLFTAYADVESCERSRINNFGSVLTGKSIVTKYQNTIIGMDQYLKSSFYAMNINVQNKQKKGHNLKPYECEPGICIPGQCNPYECQKLIMKRLMKSASASASTETRSQSISSSTMRSKHKKHQYNKVPGLVPKVENEQKGFKYQTLPRAHKKAVRVGSSFSFNIEFTKDRRTAQQVFRENKRKKIQSSSTTINTKQNASKSTSDPQIPRHNRTSQSTTTMQHKASYITPNIKRCFCTLKIQKKGRQNKALNLKMNDELAIKHDVVKTANVGQNTKRYKQYSLSELDPNECEPNVCIPGECDPYECLKRIRKRNRRRNTKTFGTDMKSKKTNASSMTSSQKASKGEEAHKKERPRASKVEGAHKKEKPRKAVKVPIEKTQPSHQVVRIGSNFSFDVEFFKEKSYPDGFTNTPNELPRSTSRKYKQKTSQNVGKDGGNTKQKSIQDSKSIRHTNSQVELPAQHDKSTKTGSLIKRCFCTANLHKQNELTKTDTTKNQKASFLTKCFCALKSLTAVKPKSKIPKTKPLAEPNPHKNEISTFAQTKNIKERRQERDIRTIELDPNECEPGVCIPGKCDPLICIERIKKRKANLNKMSSTETSNTRSTATLIKTPKNSNSTVSTANVQHKTLKNKPQVKRLTNNTKKYHKPSAKSVVRIGSNFSFNVEFYKEKHPSFENIHKRMKDIKKQKAAGTKSSSQSPSTKAKGIDKAVLLHSRESQVDHINKEDKSSDVGPVLKRCFCTLALRKQKIDGVGPKLKIKKDINDKDIKIEMSTKGTETPIKMFKNPATYKSPYTLEPYECEPGVCVPGKCDPHECIKLIKKRQRRESGTGTLKRRSKSVKTMSFRKHDKDSNIQASYRHKKIKSNKQHASGKKKPTSSQGGARQTVRIGSNFSFDVEFSKGKTGNVNNLKSSKPAHTRIDTTNHAVNSRHQKVQDKNDVHDAFSQVLAKRVRSTATEVGPLLKRCFCTLTLKTEKMPTQNKKVRKSMPKKAENITPILPYVDKVTNTNNPNNALKILDPNECEPGTCVPGKCNPRQCLERIRQRMQQQMTNTEAVRLKGISTATSKPEHGNANTTTEIQGRQIRSHEAGDNLRSEKRRYSQSPSPTNCDRQVVRIGSNFSFNIEFFKDNVMANAFNSTEKLPKPIKQTIQATNQALSTRQTKFVDRQLQSHDHKTMSRASVVGPLMKRCFCTLKLQKVGKLQQNKPAPINKMKNSSVTAKIKTKIDDRRISRNTGVGTNKKHRRLEPYECEPNTCIPGKCDPLECYERIKLRNLNDTGTDTLRFSMKYVGSSTDVKSQLKKIQTESRFHTKPTGDIKKKKPKRISHTAASPNRQSVHLGSRFNFDVEFHKESLRNDNSSKNNATPSIENHKKVRTQPTKTISRADIGRSPSTDRQSTANVVQATVGSGISPLLKRCFCTLTLHKTETNKIKYNSAKRSSINVSTKNKYTSTKKQKLQKIQVSNVVDPNKPEPLWESGQFCDTVQCNRRECLEKKKCKYRTTRTHPRLCSKQSINVSPKGESKKIQSKDSKIARVVEQPRFAFIDPVNWQGLRIGTKISFNWEFYKENAIVYEPDDNSKMKTKSTRKSIKPIDADDGELQTHAIVNEPDNNAKTNKKSTRKSIKPIDTGDGKLQTPNLLPEKKMSIAGKVLKRCFCRIENSIKSVKENSKVIRTLSRKSINRTCEFCDRKMQPPTPDKKVSLAGKVLKTCFCSPVDKQNKKSENIVTVGRLDNLITMSPFMPTQYYVYQMKQHGQAYPEDIVVTVDSKVNKYLDLKAKKKPQVYAGKNNKHVLINLKNSKSHQEHVLRKRDTTKKKDHDHLSKDIKTILSYKPRKYNTNGSSTFFSRRGIAKGAKNYCCSYRTCPEQVFNTGERLSAAKSKYVQLTAKDKNIVLHQSTASMLKKLLSMKLFSKDCNKCTNHLNQELNMLVKSNPHTVKKSKSDRRPIKISLKQQKKSESLKNTTVFIQKEECIEPQKDSRLQSGDAKSRQKFSDRSLVCYYQGFITEGQIVVVKCLGQAKDRNKNKNTNKEQKVAEENDKSLGTAKPGHIGFLFQCARTFSECKDKFISSRDTQIANSDYRKSYCICRCKDTEHPKGPINIVKYNAQKKRHALLCNTKGKIKQSYKTLSQSKGCSVIDSTDKANTAVEKVISIPCTCKSFVRNNSPKSKIKLKILPKGKRIQLRTKNDLRLQQKKKSIEMEKAQKNYRSDSVLLTESEMNTAKLGRTVDDLLRSTTRKFEECSVHNCFNHKSHPKKNKNYCDPLDFHYKAPLRKKTSFAVNRFCPWFYKHWLNMLNIWKQFTDVLLFLLAVVVWSPCIFLVEGCRAATCCTCKS